MRFYVPLSLQSNKTKNAFYQKTYIKKEGFIMNNDKLVIGGHEFHSRFILGSGKYSMKLIEAAIKDAGAEIITLAIRRANTKEQENILDYFCLHKFLLLKKY